MTSAHLTLCSEVIVKVQRNVLLLSGGMESLVLAAWMRREQPTALGYVFHVNYGQKAAEQEFRAVRAMAQTYGYFLETASLGLPYLTYHQLLDENVVCLGPRDNLRYSTKEIDARGHVIPYRNLFLASMAAGFAASIGASYVYTGFDFVAGNRGAANDKRPGFVKALNKTLEESAEGVIPVVQAPLNGNTKSDTLRLGLDLGVSWKMAWSCYNAFHVPCGVCGSCQARQDAFLDVGMADEIEYCSTDFIDSQIL